MLSTCVQYVFVFHSLAIYIMRYIYIFTRYIGYSVHTVLAITIYSITVTYTTSPASNSTVALLQFVDRIKLLYCTIDCQLYFEPINY